MTQINKACNPAKGTVLSVELFFNKKYNTIVNKTENENNTKKVAVGNPIASIRKKSTSPNPKVLLKGFFSTILEYIKSISTIARTMLQLISVVKKNCR